MSKRPTNAEVLREMFALAPVAITLLIVAFVAGVWAIVLLT